MIDNGTQATHECTVYVHNGNGPYNQSHPRRHLRNYLYIEQCNMNTRRSKNINPLKPFNYQLITDN